MASRGKHTAEAVAQQAAKVAEETPAKIDEETAAQTAEETSAQATEVLEGVEAAEEDARAAQAALDSLDVEPPAGPVVAPMSAPVNGQVPWTGQNAGWMPVQTKKRGNPVRVVAIVLTALLVMVGAAYAAGWWYFSNHFYPNTTMAGMDISYKTDEEVAQITESIGSGYTVTVRGDQAVFTASAKDNSAGIDGQALAAKALNSTSALDWPFELTKSRDYSDLVIESFNVGGLQSALQQQVDAYNETASDPQNAYIKYDEATRVYSVQPEQPGTKLRADVVIDAAARALSTMQTEVAIPEEAYIQPEILQTDERLVNAVNEANTFCQTKIDLVLGTTEIYATTIDSNEVAQWVSINDEYQVIFNEEAMAAWTAELAQSLNTVGTERTYTRPDGAVFTVAGGTYGWEIDNESLINQVREGVKSGMQGKIQVPTFTEGATWNGYGVPDWGAYADVSLSEQHARFYNANGELVWESDCVTGIPDGKHDTPVGIWSVLYTESPSELRGEMTASGTPEYITRVQYWMQFTYSGCGFHDATWQPGFGGSLYTDGYGSHGCVNLPYDKAEQLFGLLFAGNAVIVHW